MGRAEEHAGLASFAMPLRAWCPWGMGKAQGVEWWQSSDTTQLTSALEWPLTSHKACSNPYAQS